MGPDDPCPSETIVAVATPPGRGAIGIIRLSGPEALDLASKIFRTNSAHWPRPGLATVGDVIQPEGGEIIDQVVVCYFKRPHSYSGEDLIEIGCHGSPVVLQLVVDLLVRHGARLAQPGEFTMRAFLNGKIDLTQAEAINDLIHAQTQFQSRIAAQQVRGSLAKELEPAKSRLLNLIVEMETAVEFADERLVEVDRARFVSAMSSIRESLERLAGSYQFGRILREGLQLAIAGKPNVGKSSLFNRLVSRDRAIVTEVPGTTRDTLEETVSLAGVPLRLVDTAGMRHTADPVETLGIERTKQAVADADLVILVFDCSRPFDDQDEEILKSTSEARCLLVLNKTDLPSGWDRSERPVPTAMDSARRISAKSGDGIEELKQAILGTVVDRDKLGIEDAIITNVRHHRLLRSAAMAMLDARTAMNAGASEEVPLSCLHEGLRHLGELTGETTVEDILHRIFSTFCVGK